jgi:hypothetical protein
MPVSPDKVLFRNVSILDSTGADLYPATSWSRTTASPPSAPSMSTPPAGPASSRGAAGP